MKSLKLIGFLQALGLAAYIVLFATIANQVQTWVKDHAIGIHPVAGVTLFLLAFVMSALICGLITLAYPVFLFSHGRREDAMRVVAWSVAWLMLVLLAILVGWMLV